MTLNLGGTVQGDLPWLERRRGGERHWTEEDSDVARGVVSRFSDARSDRDDDFEALKQAVLSGLNKRMRKRAVVVPGDEGEGVKVIDLGKRGSQRELVDRVMHGEKDNMAMLQRMQRRLDRVGMQQPTVEVRYRGLSVMSHMAVSDRALPTLRKTVRRQAEPVLRAVGRAPPRTLFPIIEDVSGVIKPGVFTILLGPPGSGKTTLLRTLAGVNRKHTNLKVQAQELSYNGHSLHEFVVERSSAYISQMDEHYGELTVRETFDYSARFQGSGYRESVLEEVKKREQEQGIMPDPELDAYMQATAVKGKGNLIVEVIIQLLGLDVCADTVVGNAMLRGISGGQRKRVTTGEMAVGPIRAFFADEISTGLDSNTTYQIMRALRNFTHLHRATMVVGLLQPQPETFDLFDDVMLISNGKICFHGPREAVLPFFEGLGLSCPPRRSIPDFLQEVTTPSDQHKYWAMSNNKPYRYVSVKVIEAAFKRSREWQAIEAHLAQPFDKSQADPRALAKTKYGQPKSFLLRTNFRRQLTLLQRNKIFAIIRTAQVTLMAFVVSTVFWREDKNTVSDGNMFMSIIFYSVLYMLLGAISEMHILVDRLPVFVRQRDVNFYPGWCFALPSFFLRVPWSFLEATIWTNLVYWIVGFSPNVRFLMFWLQLFLINIWSINFFQLIAAVTRDDTIATSCGSFFLLLFINLTGFVLNKADIPPWWIWGYWPNPFAWVTRALAINEFTSSHWLRPDPNNPGTLLGYNVLQFRALPTEYWWVWASVGFLLATMAIFIALFVAAMTYLGAPRQSRSISPEALQEYQVSRKEVVSPRPSIDENVAGAAERGEAVWWTNQAAGDKPGTDEARPVRAGSASSIEGARPPVTVEEVRGGEEAPALSAERSPAAAADGAEQPVSPRRASTLRSSQRLSRSSQNAESYRQRTAIKFEPVAITFRNVEYSVPLPPDADRSRADVPSEGPHAGNLRLLRGINGAFRPNVLTALMGASGAGKSTLMDVLADRKTSGVITGDIKINGFPKDPATFARIMGYVEQTDIHIPQQTVAEACHFSARLRLPTSVDATTRQHYVEEVMALVELDKLRNAYVGVPGVSGLSVEQRKRLTLAVEVVANPSVVFMDEPTSGLDARAAGVVMNAVRATVDTGRTVVCTIHQPSVDIFEAFDELLLLKPGGATVYFGPMGDESSALIDYLQSIPGVKPCPPRYNPANWMLEVTNPQSEEALGLDFEEVYKSSPLAKEMDEVIKKYEEPTPGAQPMQMGEMLVPGFKEQFMANLGRNFTIYNRAPEYNVTRAAVTLLIAFVFGSMFWRQGSKYTTVTGVLNIMGVLFSSTLFLGISNCLTVQHLIAAQRTVFYRERAAGMYKVLPFALAQQLVEVPYLIGQSIMYVSIVYWMIWFARDAGKFFWFLWFFGLTLWYFTALGIASVNLTPSVPLANILCSFFFGFWNLLSGFLIPIPQQPRYWFWASYIDPVMWSIYSLVITQLGDLNDDYITDLNGQTMSIPDYLAETFQYHTYMEGPIVVILLAYVVSFGVIAAVSLKLLNYQRR